jgi:hypothetical protein
MENSAAELGMFGSAQAQSVTMHSTRLPTIRPGPNTSFRSLKPIDAGVLSVEYVDARYCLRRLVVIGQLHSPGIHFLTKLGKTSV